MTSSKKKFQTKEPQYQVTFDTCAKEGAVVLGPMTSYTWRTDPRRLGFLLARYKFCAKMLSGKSAVLEVGCGDAFATDVVLQEVGRVHAVDFDPSFIEEARSRTPKRERLTFEVADLTKQSVPGKFDGAYSLDVLEHIPKNLEETFLSNICKSVDPQAVCILGSPSLESQPHASPDSKIGHINCKSGSQLKALLLRHFHNALIFSMNDEMVHVGFWPMAHYLLGMGIGVKRVFTEKVFGSAR